MCLIEMCVMMIPTRHHCPRRVWTVLIDCVDALPKTTTVCEVAVPYYILKTSSDTN